jgi:hypothetical protein
MITTKLFDSTKKDIWNNFISQKSLNGTIFHHLDFLAYHQNRFTNNEHHLAFYKGEELVGLMPLAIFEQEGIKIAKSPYGASWGGLVFSENLKLKYHIELIESLVNYLKDLQVNEIFITPTPSFYYKNYSSFFEFALFQSGFQLKNRDVMHVVTLPKNAEETMQVLDSKCRNQTRRALEQVEIIENATIEDFYIALQEDKIRHNSTPTHTLEEMKRIQELNTDFMQIDVAKDNEGNKAGICYFKGNSQAIMTFYMAQQNAILGKNALNALVFKGMERAVKQGFKYFDFGCSSVGGKIQNIGVSEFKESFGAKGMLRETYYLKV